MFNSINMLDPESSWGFISHPLAMFCHFLLPQQQGHGVLAQGVRGGLCPDSIHASILDPPDAFLHTTLGRQVGSSSLVSSPSLENCSLSYAGAYREVIILEGPVTTTWRSSHGAPAPSRDPCETRRRKTLLKQMCITVISFLSCSVLFVIPLLKPTLPAKHPCLWICV